MNNPFFISDKFFSQKQFFHIIDVGYDAQCFIIGQLQSDGSMWNTKRMNKLIYTEILTFPENILQYSCKLPFIYTGDLVPVEVKSIPFTFFLTLGILFSSFSLENLVMTIFGPLLGNKWEAPMLEGSFSTSNF